MRAEAHIEDRGGDVNYRSGVEHRGIQLPTVANASQRLPTQPKACASKWLARAICGPLMLACLVHRNYEHGAHQLAAWVVDPLFVIAFDPTK